MDPRPPALTRTQAEELRKMRALSQSKAREHFKGARRMSRLHSMLMVPTVILSTLAGTASINNVGSMSSCEGAAPWYQWMSVVCSIVVAVLSALATLLDFRSQQGRHTEALRGYHKVLRRVDALLRQPNAPDDFESVLSSLQGEMILVHDNTVSLANTSYMVT